jgi:hypothetical protein
MGGVVKANQTTATHTIAASTAITTKIRSPVDMVNRRGCYGPGALLMRFPLLLVAHTLAKSDGI